MVRQGSDVESFSCCSDTRAKQAYLVSWLRRAKLSHSELDYAKTG